MKNNSIVTVKEWFFDKLYDTMSSYKCLPRAQYKTEDGIQVIDRTKLFVTEVLAESEKAYKIAVDAETYAGNYKSWTTWLPKSVVEA